ncbi:MAG: GNAT family N-acetyltransferase [Labilithrix sp.]|nr:GNAT family N-acetyltransferase [Labilithrix sp.]MCW5814376.1 GNAT family N-acetyltransferase [Labilithrix sp.]
MSRPPFIKHWRDVIGPDEAGYPGSEERFTIGSPIGRATGLLRIGVHHETLLPGRRSSWPHAERDEEELVFVLQGTPDVWIDGELHRLEPGDGVGFPCATGIAHTFINDTDQPVRLLSIGERSKPTHAVYYPLHPAHQEILGERDWKDAPKRPLGAHDGKPARPTRPQAVLVTERLRLRPVRLEDAQAYYELRRDPEVARFLLRRAPASVDEAQSALARVLESNQPAWALTRVPDDMLLGIVGLPRFDAANRCSSISFELRRDEWGKHLMSEAAARVIEHAFGKLGLHRIQAEIDPKNHPSIHLAETLGFVREGVLRDNVFHDGAYSDTAIYARFAPR